MDSLKLQWDSKGLHWWTRFESREGITFECNSAPETWGKWHGWYMRWQATYPNGNLVEAGGTSRASLDDVFTEASRVAGNCISLARENIEHAPPLGVRSLIQN